MKLGRKVCHGAVALVLILPFGVVAHAATQGAGPIYRITKLGEPGYTWSAGYGINDEGIVVGAASFQNQRIQAHLWNPGGAGTALPAFEGNVFGESRAQAISNTGVAVGNAFDANMDQIPVFWIEGSIVDAGLPRGPGYGGGEAASISRNGRYVTGTLTDRTWDSSFTTETVSERMFLLTDGRAIDVHGPTGSYGARAVDVNSSGVVIGTYLTLGGSGHTQSFRWENGTLMDLTPPFITDSQSVQVMAINDQGLVAGIVLDDAGTTRPFVVDEAGNFQFLDLPELADRGGFVSDLNEAGLILGGYYQQTGWTEIADRHRGTLRLPIIEARGGIWRDGEFFGLEDISDAAEEGWSAISPMAVNGSGQIAGFGMIDSQMHAFLLTPVPEPSTAFLTGGGIAILVLSMRARVARTRIVAVAG